MKRPELPSQTAKTVVQTQALPDDRQAGREWAGANRAAASRIGDGNMKPLVLLCGIVIYFVAIPLAAPYILGALLGFSGDVSQGLVFWSILMLPWIPVAAWIIFRLSRRRN
jgi:hypothetical protein